MAGKKRTVVVAKRAEKSKMQKREEVNTGEGQEEQERPKQVKRTMKTGSKKATGVMQIEKPVKKHKSKSRNARAGPYSYFIWKLLKQVYPHSGISFKSMCIMNSFVADIFEKLAGESARLLKMNKRRTLTAREIQTATRLVLSGELAAHAVSEGTKAISKFYESKEKQ